MNGEDLVVHITAVNLAKDMATYKLGAISSSDPENRNQGIVGRVVGCPRLSYFSGALHVPQGKRKKKAFYGE